MYCSIEDNYGENISNCTTNTWELFDHRSLLQTELPPTSCAEVQFSGYQKNTLQEWSMVKKLSCVSCAVWNVFPIIIFNRAIHNLVWIFRLFKLYNYFFLTFILCNFMWGRYNIFNKILNYFFAPENLKKPPTKVTHNRFSITNCPQTSPI